MSAVPLRTSYPAIVFTIIILATFYVARGFLLPVFAALLLSYALIPAVRGMVKIKIPRVLASLIAVTLFFSAIIYGLISLSGPAMEWLERAPHSFDKIEEFAKAIKKPVENVSAATEQLNKIAQGEGSNRDVVVTVRESSFLEILLTQTPIVLGATISTFILTFFLLSFGNVILARVVEALPHLKEKKVAVEAARDVEQSVSRYLVTVSTINIMLGTSVGLALYFLGFENPAFWGTIAAAFNFIPYLGAIAGVGLLALASLSVTDSLEAAFIYPAAYLALTLIEGNFITPLLLGNSFTINPVFIILVLIFLGWLWGIPGAIMAVPLLIALKTLAESFERTRPLSTVISR